MNTRPWLITAPSIGLILLFVAWSGYWYFLVGTAESKVEDALPRLESSGFKLTCSEKSYGGYPFRVKFSCKNPRFDIQKETVSASFKADHLTALAQAYKLGHLIGEIEGDLDFKITRNSKVTTIPATVTTGTVKSGSLRASAEFKDLRSSKPVAEKLKAFSLVSHNPKANIVQTTAWGEKIPLKLTADKTGLHIREPRHPGTKGTDADLALEVVNLFLKGKFKTALEGDQLTAKRIVLNALVRPFYPALGGKASIARTWQSLGGVSEIDALLIEKDEFTLRGEGVLSLNNDGQLSGSLDTKFLGLVNIFKTLIERKVLSGEQAMFAYAGLKLLSKPTPEEEKLKILTIPVNFKNGQIYFGPQSIGFSPSLF